MGTVTFNRSDLLSEGYKSFSECPPASVIGIGQVRVGGVLYECNGVNFTKNSLSSVMTANHAGLRLIPVQSHTLPATIGATAGGYNINVQLPALDTFYGVRLIFQNWNTAATMDFTGVKVAACPVHGTLPNNNGALLWQGFVKVNNNQAFSVPAATTVGTQVAPGTVITDLLFIKSTSRTDVVGAPPLLRVASHVAENTIHPTIVYTKVVDSNTYVVPGVTPNPGLYHAFGIAADTLANLTSTALSTPTSSNQAINPVGAIFYYDNPKTDFICFADSILEGTGTYTTYCGLTNYLTYNSFATSKAISGMNFGVGGHKTATSLQMLADTLSLIKPRYAIFKNYSPNDGQQDIGWINFLDSLRVCREKGVTPIALTSPPTGSNWMEIKALNAKTLTQLPSDVITIDFATLVNDPANDGNHLSKYYKDGIHVNDLALSDLANLILANLAL